MNHQGDAIAFVKRLCFLGHKHPTWIICIKQSKHLIFSVKYKLSSRMSPLNGSVTGFAPTRMRTRGHGTGGVLLVCNKNTAEPLKLNGSAHKPALASVANARRKAQRGEVYSCAALHHWPLLLKQYHKSWSLSTMFSKLPLLITSMINWSITLICTYFDYHFNFRSYQIFQTFNLVDLTSQVFNPIYKM